MYHHHHRRRLVYTHEECNELYDVHLGNDFQQYCSSDADTKNKHKGWTKRMEKKKMYERINLIETIWTRKKYRSIFSPFYPLTKRALDNTDTENW